MRRRDELLGKRDSFLKWMQEQSCSVCASANRGWQQLETAAEEMWGDWQRPWRRQKQAAAEHEWGVIIYTVLFVPSPASVQPGSQHTFVPVSNLKEGETGEDEHLPYTFPPASLSARKLFHIPSSGSSPQFPQGLLIYSGNGCAMKRVLWFTVPGATVCQAPVVPSWWHRKI